jgi:hypothetical protein
MKKDIPMELDTVNRLYLELSQVATATTSREIALNKALTDANEVCRSMMAISSRKGEETNWDAFRTRLQNSLDLQHRILHPDRYDNDGKPLQPWQPPNYSK